MALISLQEAKQYLRVDSSYEDGLIGSLITSSEMLCCEIARLSDEKWDAVCDEENNSKDIVRIREIMRVAILYMIGYLYEHREEADHHDLVITLRNLLFSIREGIF